MVGDRERVGEPAKASLVEAMLEEGLRLFGHNRTDHAVAVWRRVLELAPDNPRALDYLDSAGAPVETPIVRLVPRSSNDFPAVVVSEAERAAAESEHRTSAPVAIESIPPPPQRTRVPLWLLIVVALAAIAAAVGAIIATLGLRDRGIVVEPRAEVAATTVPSEPEPPVPERAPAPAVEPDFFKVVLEVEPETAAIEIDGVEVARGVFVGRFPRDGVRHKVTLRAEGYQPRELTFVDAEPPSRFELEAVVATSQDRGRAVRRAERRRRRQAERSRGGPTAQPPAAAPAEPSAPPPTPSPAAAPKTDNIDPWSSP